MMPINPTIITACYVTVVLLALLIPPVNVALFIFLQFISPAVIVIFFLAGTFAMGQLARWTWCLLYRNLKKRERHEDV